MTKPHEHHHALSYADEVRRYRAEKDAYFRTGQASPVPAGERASFAGVPYFPVDESFIAEDLVLEPYGGHEPMRFRDPNDRRTSPSRGAGGRVPLHAAGRATTPDRIPDDRRGGRGRRDAIRALPGRDYRDRHLRGRALSRPRGHRMTGPGPWTSTSRITRLACTTPTSRVRSLHRRTAWACGSRQASGSRSITPHPADDAHRRAWLDGWLGFLP